MGLGNSKFNLDLQYRAIILLLGCWLDAGLSCGLVGVGVGLCMIRSELDLGRGDMPDAVCWLGWSGLDD